MPYLNRLVNDMNTSSPNNKTFSILALVYTLVPEAHYPTQLTEATTLLSHLLTSRDPSRIILAGDSAGGNLLLSLLSHLAHPSLPEVPRIELSAPLRGALLISPWVSFSTRWPSFTRNKGKDTLEKSMLENWGRMYLGAAEHAGPSANDKSDSFNEPLKNHPAWWTGLPSVVSTVLVTVGKNEVFLDPIRAFAKTLTEGWEYGKGKGGEGVEVCEAEGECHIGPIMDVLMQQFDKRSESEVKLQAWLRRCME